MKHFIIFLVLNFAALAIGGLATSSGVISDWYTNLNQAPWTPPGWVFGTAWTTIMLCYAYYMSQLWEQSENKNSTLILYGIQWVLNVIWNPIFFTWHLTGWGLVVIVALTVLIAYFLFYFYKNLQWKSVFIAPYFIWLCIATSLNAYIVFNN